QGACPPRRHRHVSMMTARIFPSPSSPQGERKAAGDPAVELRHLTRSFSDPDGAPRMVLDRFDLEVATGECVAITGPSGRGKTTLLRLVAGLLPPDDGEVHVLGSTPQEARNRKAMG